MILALLFWRTSGQTHIFAFFMAHSRYLVVSFYIFITQQQQQHINNNNKMANFRPNPYKKKKSPPAPPPPSTGPVKNSHSKLAQTFVPNKKQRQFANESPAAKACSTVPNLNNGVVEKLHSVPISIFEVFAGGLFCSSCDKPVSISLESVRRHLKSAHPTFFREIDNVAKFHMGLLSEMKKLRLQTALLPGGPPPLIRFKCASCNKSYNLKQNFNKHVRVSGGRCNGSSPIETPYHQLPCGQFVQVSNPTNITVNPPDILHDTNVSFRTIETTISAYVRDDEDSGTFVSLFGPLMENSKKSFESIMCDFIDRYEQPPASHEQSLQTLLAMGEKWLLERARHEVSLIPGNYRASLLQLDAQDMGEVSQNLTYNFRHREQTLLPELKKLLAFLWRSPHPFSRILVENDPYFVARFVTVFFHEKTPTVFSHPALIQFTLSRLFRKSYADGSLKMVSAGQNASLAAAVLALLRSATCSLICSARVDVDNFAYRLVRESQLCRTANILAPIIRRLREMERRKKKKRMVTVDETGSIAVDGFEIFREQWSRLVPNILSRCESILTSLLVGEDWRLVLDLNTLISVADNFSFSISGKDESPSPMVSHLKQPVDFMLLDQLCSYLEVAFHGLGLGSLRYIELERMEVSRCIWHRSTVYYDIYSEKKYSSTTKSGKPVEHKLPQSIARLYLLHRHLVNPIEEFSSALAVPRRRASNHSMRHAVAEIFCFSEVPDAVQVRHFWTSILNYLFPSGDLSGALYAEKDVAESSGHASRTHQVKYSSNMPGGKEYLYRTLHHALGEQPAGGGDNSNLHVRPADLLSALRLFFGPGASYTSIHQQELVEFAASSTTGHGHADSLAVAESRWLGLSQSRLDFSLAGALPGSVLSL